MASDDPAIQRHLAAPRSAWLRGHWFRGMKFDPRQDNLLSMQDEKAHAELRSKLMPGVRVFPRHLDPDTANDPIV